jgi:hypothetical protein
MRDDYIFLQCLLWVTTLGFLTAFDYVARKRLGVKSQGYVNLRLPKFISLAISSLTAIIALFTFKNGLIAESMASYLSIPYFASTSYFIVSFFRQIKETNQMNRK